METGHFRTNVLRGLIPGMDEATLWNSPLHMTLLAGVYTLTGESLIAGRSMSLLFAFGVVFLFARITRRFFGEDNESKTSGRLLILLPLLLVFDLTFQRSANTIRMDALALLFFLGAYDFLTREFYAGRRSLSRPFLAGLCMGLAALTHPIAILLPPVVILWLGLRPVAILTAALGAVAGLLPWLPYILAHPQIFCVQFMSQLVRKQDILSVTGGDTGGMFVVFTSQYGGSFWWMFGAAIAFAFVLGAGLLSLVEAARSRGLRELVRSSFFRIYLSFVVVFVMVLFASEAWYPVYVGPWFLWTAAALFQKGEQDRTARSRRVILRTALMIVGGFLILSSLGFTAREHGRGTAHRAADFTQRLAVAASSCESVYVRSFPDPYFALRRSSPQTEVLEFVPGKLIFDPERMPLQSLRECIALPGGQRAYLRRRFAEIECFLLNPADDWEPILRDYLRENSSDFTVTPISAEAPLAPARLFRRIR